jgi:hypothetical protein
MKFTPNLGSTQCPVASTQCPVASTLSVLCRWFLERCDEAAENTSDFLDPIQYILRLTLGKILQSPRQKQLSFELG